VVAVGAGGAAESDPAGLRLGLGREGLATGPCLRRARRREHEQPDQHGQTGAQERSRHGHSAVAGCHLGTFLDAASGSQDLGRILKCRLAADVTLATQGAVRRLA
jgi:hypothetical protein